METPSRLLELAKQAESFYFCVDFETVGGIPSKNGFTCCGATIMDNKDNCYFEFEGFANMSHYEKDDICYQEFWSKHPLKYHPMMEKCQLSNESPFKVCQRLLDTADAVIDMLNIPRGKITPLTDCTGFDPMLLGFFSDKDNMRLFGKYSPWLDVSSFYKGIGRKRLSSEMIHQVSSKKMAISGIQETKPDFIFIPPSIPHDHSPLNDAKNIVITFNQINNQL
jgi:hypothetical protein